MIELMIDQNDGLVIRLPNPVYVYVLIPPICHSQSSFVVRHQKRVVAGELSQGQVEDMRLQQGTYVVSSAPVQSGISTVCPGVDHVTSNTGAKPKVYKPESFQGLTQVVMKHRVCTMRTLSGEIIHHFCSPLVPQPFSIFDTCVKDQDL
jgi:hypothetical protein